jgi:pyrophosphatase PpaX
MPAGLCLSKFRAVLFDVDGTLVDSLPALVRGLGDAYERFSGVRPLDSEIQALIGMPLREQLKLFREAPPAEAELQEMIAYTIGRFEANRDLEREFEPAIEALRLCAQAGLRVALVTSKSRAELELFLPRFAAASLVHAVVSASDVPHPKPHPDSAWLACERLGVPPEEAVFIGDSIFDIRCAQSAALAAVAVTYGSGARDALFNEQPDLVVETPEELLEWVRASLLTPSCPERS